jgi:hypothetical protein
MNSLLTFLLPAIAPAITDGIRGLIARFTGNAGAQPVNVDERIRLIEADTARMQALAMLDQPGGIPAQWIINVRAIYRYVAITLIWLILWWAVATNQSIELTMILLDMCGATLSFIIGERFYLKMRGK